MRHVGLGDLLERLERLRRSSPPRGSSTPTARSRSRSSRTASASITGKDSDAEKDVLRNAQLRWPSVRFRVVHAAVQGDRDGGRGHRGDPASSTPTPRSTSSSSPAAAATSRTCSASATRALVRAAAAATTPIVSAIGHEADRPLLDDVADLRASTPTDAAKRVVPDVAEELQRRAAGPRPHRACGSPSIVSVEIDRLGQLRTRPVLAQPATLVDVRADELARYVARSEELLDRVIERARRGSSELTGHLRALSPERPSPRLRDRPAALGRRPARRRRCPRRHAAPPHPRHAARSARRAPARLGLTAPVRIDVHPRSIGSPRGTDLSSDADVRPDADHAVADLTYEQARDELIRVVNELEQGVVDPRAIARPLGARRGARRPLRGVAARRQGASRAARSTEADANERTPPTPPPPLGKQRAPRVVAELGRPETPDETAARKAASSRAHRENQTAFNLVIAIVVSVGIVVLLVLVVVRPGGIAAARASTT